MQRVQRLARHLAKQPSDAARPPRTSHQPHTPHKLSQRLDAATVDAVITAYQAGAPARELASRYGVARSSITRLLHQHGVPVRRQSPTAAERQRIEQLHAIGLSMPAVATQLGWSVSTVSRVLARIGRLN